jgi:hypothetical protein
MRTQHHHSFLGTSLISGLLIGTVSETEVSSFDIKKKE